VALLNLMGVSVKYNSVEALKEVSLSLTQGEILGVIGPNGSGKSTLLKAIYKALRFEGEIKIRNRDLLEMSRREIAKHISVVPQEFHPEFPFSALELVLTGRTPHLSPLRPESEKDLRIAEESLEEMGAIHLKDRDLRKMSGGERQKVLIARALAQEGEILLMDEPTSHLDMRNSIETMEKIKEIVSRGKGAVVVMHDLNLASRYCDKLLLLKEGIIHSMGRPKKVITEENIEEVYRVRVKVFGDPPIVVPLGVIGDENQS